MIAWPKTSVATLMWFSVAALSACSSSSSGTGGNGLGSSGGSGIGSTHGSDGGSSSSGDDDGSDSGSFDPGSSDGGSSGSDDSGSTGTGSSPDAAAHHHDGGSSGSDAGGTTPVTDSGVTITIDAGGDSLTAARAQCVQIINAYRATLSPPSPALSENTAEETCVDGQAKADFTANTAHSAFGNCKEFAQDECPGWPGPPASINTDCFKQMWAEGPPPAGQDNHWLNMSNKDYTKVACGYYQTPSGDWWTTQDFW